MPPRSRAIAVSFLLCGCALAARPVAAAPDPKADSRLLTFDTCANVLEGDLIEAKKVGQIRLIGIIAPAAGEAGYHDALVYTKRLVMGKPIKIDICSERPNDYRGRLRAIVYLPDGTNLNTKILRAGWARVLEHKPCHVDASAWQTYETQARDAKLGLWAPADGRASGDAHTTRPAPRKPAGSARVRIRPKR